MTTHHTTPPGESFASRPLPACPLLTPWISIVDMGEGRVQLRAEDFALSFDEPFLASLFSNIAPLLDGEHSVEQIANAQGGAAMAGSVRFVLHVLHAHGALQEGAPFEGQPDAEQLALHAPLLAALAHLTHQPRRALAQLFGAQIVLVGDESMCHALASELSGLGISPRTDERPPEAPCDLLVALAPSSRRGFFEDINRLTLHTGQRWLRVTVEGGHPVLGPTIVPYQTPCHTCTEARKATHRTNPSYGDWQAFQNHLDTAAQVPDEGRFPPLQSALLGHAAMEVMRLIIGVAPPTTFGRCYHFGARSPAVVGHDILRVPRCPSCGTPPGPDPWRRPPEREAR